MPRPATPLTVDITATAPADHVTSPWPASGAELSVVIPSHGRPATLEDAVRSVLSQTERVREIIVVSDVNDPAGAAVVTALAGSSEVPIRWIDRSDDGAPGVSGSRNRGIAEAAGRWSTVLDDDDEWVPTFVAEMTAAINRAEVRFALCAKVRFGNPTVDGTVVHVHPGFSGSQMIRDGRFAHGGNLVIETDLARQYPYDTQFQGAEDWDLFIRLDADGVAYEAVDLPLLRSRIHGGSRVSQSGLHIARMCRQLARKHRHGLDLPARRKLLFEAAWIERRALPTRSGRFTATVRLFAFAPYERLLTDGTYRTHLVRRSRRIVTRRPS